MKIILSLLWITSIGHSSPLYPELSPALNALTVKNQKPLRAYLKTNKGPAEVQFLSETWPIFDEYRAKVVANTCTRYFRMECRFYYRWREYFSVIPVNIQQAKEHHKIPPPFFISLNPKITKQHKIRLNEWFLDNEGLRMGESYLTSLPESSLEILNIPKFHFTCEDFRWYPGKIDVKAKEQIAQINTIEMRENQETQEQVMSFNNTIAWVTLSSTPLNHYYELSSRINLREGLPMILYSDQFVFTIKSPGGELCQTTFQINRRPKSRTNYFTRINGREMAFGRLGKYQVGLPSDEIVMTITNLSGQDYSSLHFKFRDHLINNRIDEIKKTGLTPITPQNPLETHFLRHQLIPQLLPPTLDHIEVK